MMDATKFLMDFLCVTVCQIRGGEQTGVWVMGLFFMILLVLFCQKKVFQSNGWQSNNREKLFSKV